MLWELGKGNQKHNNHSIQQKIIIFTNIPTDETSNSHISAGKLIQVSTSVLAAQELQCLLWGGRCGCAFPCFPAPPSGWKERSECWQQSTDFPSAWPSPQSPLATSLIMMLYMPRMNQEKALTWPLINIPLPWEACDYMSNIVMAELMK